MVTYGDYVNGSEENNDVLHLQNTYRVLGDHIPIYSNFAMYAMSVVFVSTFAIPMSVDSVGSRVWWGRFLMLSKLQGLQLVQGRFAQSIESRVIYYRWWFHISLEILYPEAWKKCSTLDCASFLSKGCKMLQTTHQLVTTSLVAEVYIHFTFILAAMFLGSGSPGSETVIGWSLPWLLTYPMIPACQ